MNTDLDWRYSQAYPKEPVERLAKRLKREWLAFKDSEKVTQTIAAEHLGISLITLSFISFIDKTLPTSFLSSHLFKSSTYMLPRKRSCSIL